MNMPDIEEQFNDPDRPEKINEETGGAEGSRVFEYFPQKAEDQRPKIIKELKTFFETTKIDSELAEIEEEKGDLPQNIEQLREKVGQLDSSLTSLNERLETNVIDVAELTKINKSFEERVSKFDEKKYSAKSNKEYDSITKAIDAAFEEVEKNEKTIRELIGSRDKLQVEIEEKSKKLEELRSELEEKENTLNELNQEFEDEERDLKKKREELLSVLPEDHRKLYEKLNKVHKGEATAIVRKDNCTGCYNSIPPQKVIEIKMAEKIYTCHSCGRILISEELIMENT
jgi:predicted  nucleic acid-binding Zn-ribbon protein